MRWNRKYLNLMYFGRKLEVVTSLQFKYYTLLNFRLRNRVFLLWSRWRKWYLIIFPFLLFCKKKRKICTCHFNHMRMSTWWRRLLQCQQFFLSFSEPRTEILGDQELFVDYASSLNLTCLVISPNPPAFVFWKLSEKVSNKIKVYGH